MKRLFFAAAILAATPALSQDGGAGVALEQFLAANGQDIDACFAGIPEVTDALRAAHFEGAGDEGPVPPRRLVIAFDASGSMAGALGGGTKMDGARDVVTGLLDGLPDDVTVGLVAFGHRGTNEDAGRAESCSGVETLAQDEPAASSVLRERMASLSPTGWTPLADALAAAGAQMTASGSEGEQVVYVVSDGEETCGGDPVAAARELHESDIRAVVNVLGMDLPAEERAQLEAVAAAGGGVFSAIETESDVQRRIDELFRQNANAVEILTTRNQSNILQVRNRNAINTALLKLDNCISTRSLFERNRASGYARTEGVSPEDADALRDALAETHEAYEDRAATIRTEAEAALDAANTALERKKGEAETEYERLR